MIQIDLRNPDGSDDAAIAHLIYDAIHQGRSLYTAEERQAWMPAPHSGEAWSKRLAAQRVFLARNGKRVIGAMTLKGDYIDLAYVAPARQGQGLFRRLFELLETEARRAGIRRLTTHASLMAQPAFLAVGFRVIRHEKIAQSGQMLARAEMEKDPL
ncbi:MAG: GNAT family N-acetyltransferase [Sulfitobacter sp.]|nr:GNAT family N-acetyltransferase [Sulfitobacter sp.]